MDTWNILILIINMAILFMVAKKITQFSSLYQDNLRVQNNMESLVEQNSQLVNIILDELEGKLQEVRGLREEIEQQPYVTPQDEAELTIATPEPRSQQESLAEEAFFNLSKTNSSKINYLRQMGMSVQEIAQTLHLSQGEIALKLNLQEKQNSSSPKLRKIK